MQQPNLNGVKLHFPNGIIVDELELVDFEPGDDSVGIGHYIRVKTTKGDHFVLNDNGQNWVHPLKSDFTGFEYPDWNSIVGTFSGDLFPEPELPTITARSIIECLDGWGLACDASELIDLERLDQYFGIGLDTELQVS